MIYFIYGRSVRHTKSKGRKHGFTLVELLVVIAIIAVLSVAGVTIFTGVQKNARDSKRRADIEAIAKAYEVGYNGRYFVLNADSFSEGSLPDDPAKGDYFNWLDAEGRGFKVCASLENNPNAVCNTPAQNCYCQFSSQGTITPSSTPDSSSKQTNIGFGGVSTFIMRSYRQSSNRYGWLLDNG